MTELQLNELKNAPKDFFMKGWKLHNKIDAKLDRIRNWQQIAESITAEVTPDGGYGSRKASSKVEACVVNIVDLQNEIKEDISRLIDIEKAIKEAIEMTPDKNNMRLLLELRHLNYYSWEKVAECMGCSCRWVFNLYGACMKFFEKLEISSC